MKVKFVLLIAALCVVIGFFIGKSKSKTIEDIKYVAQEVQQGELFSSDLTPTLVERPISPELPVTPIYIIRDSIEYIMMQVDTAKIIAEYELIKTYQKTLFDNEYGKLDINLKTRYNSLAELNYSFTPITQIKTIVKKDIWQPFISIGYSSNTYFQLGVGTFYHKIGLEYTYNRNFPLQTQYYTLSLKYKF